jgi:hypothetical protein
LISPQGLLIDGYKRYRLCLRSGKDEIDTIRLSGASSPYTCAQYRIACLPSGSDPDILQKVSLYDFVKSDTTQPVDCERIRMDLNLPSSKADLIKFVRILNWPDAAKEYLSQFHVSYNQVKPLLNSDGNELEPLFNIGIALRIRPVEFLNIALQCHEIALNKDISVSTLFLQPPLSDIFSDPSLNRNQKIALLKSTVTTLRMPMISTFRQSVENDIKNLGLSRNIVVKYDKSFESGTLNMELRLTNPGDFKAVRDQLTDKNTEEIIARIFRKL